MNPITKINWTVRLKNKSFWMAMIPAVLLAGQRISVLFGLSFSLSQKQGELLDIVNVLFIILALVGVVADPTVQGIADSERAMQYDTPAPNAK